MRSRRLLALALGTCLVVAVSPRSIYAQPGGGAGGGATGGGGGGTSMSSTGGSGYGGAGSSGSSTSTGAGVTATSSSAQSLTILATSSGNGTASGSPSTSNANVKWYGNPYSMGLPSNFVANSPTATFGKVIYTSTTQSTPSASTATTTANGFATTGTMRNPAYITVLSDDLPAVVHKSDVLQADLRDVIARSTRLPSKNNVQVRVNGGAVVLTGLVSTDRERQVVEGIVTMTPGVRGFAVQNQLQVMQAK